MFQTICAKCGVSCEVPFRPVNGKPAYCKNCFDKGGNNNFPPLTKGRPGGVAGSSDHSQNQFDSLNAKLDKILKLLGSNPPVAIGAKKEKSEEKTEEVKETVSETSRKKAKSPAKAKTAPKKATAKKKK
jgi:CxxC-x17-CxxC domain-containing protein